MPDKPKPKQYNSFEDLTRKLLKVPQAELDKKVQLYNARKTAKRKKDG